jgi:hypothetical protein
MPLYMTARLLQQTLLGPHHPQRRVGSMSSQQMSIKSIRKGPTANTPCCYTSRTSHQSATVLQPVRRCELVLGIVAPWKLANMQHWCYALPSRLAFGASGLCRWTMRRTNLHCGSQHTQVLLTVVEVYGLWGEMHATSKSDRHTSTLVFRGMTRGIPRMAALRVNT